MNKANGTNNVGHGHVYPRPDGVRMRCGGPLMCTECALDEARKLHDEKNFHKAFTEAANRINKAINAELDQLSLNYNIPRSHLSIEWKDEELIDVGIDSSNTWKSYQKAKAQIKYEV